jgi:RNAse (barnase) inhibitor barstar
MSTPALDKLAAQCLKPTGPAVLEVTGLTAEEALRLVTMLAPHNILGRVIDASRLGTKADLLRAVATAFAFPSHYGQNFDALIDCWSDMSWLPAKGYVGIVLGAEAFRRKDPTAYETFIEVCDDVAERWREYDPSVVFKVVRSA